MKTDKLEVLSLLIKLFHLIPSKDKSTIALLKIQEMMRLKNDKTLQVSMKEITNPNINNGEPIMEFSFQNKDNHQIAHIPMKYRHLFPKTI